MNMSYKRVYFNKNKKPKNFADKSDPISSGIRTGLLSKIDTIYQQIARLQTQNLSVKKPHINKLSYSIPRINQKQQTQQAAVLRIKTDHSMRETKNCQESMRKTSYSNSKLRTDTNFYIKKKQKQVKDSSRYKCPSTHSRIRQMLKCKQKLQQEQMQNLMKNPYYKIMKKRVKSELESNRSEYSEQIRNSILCTEYLNDMVEDNVVLSNKYSDCLMDSKRKESQQFSQRPDIRQKSETKVYEEIKKYFQEKYGSAKKDQGK